VPTIILPVKDKNVLISCFFFIKRSIRYSEKKKVVDGTSKKGSAEK
jgi:hypothetical protein